MTKIVKKEREHDYCGELEGIDDIDSAVDDEWAAAVRDMTDDNEKVFKYLYELRESGETNMFGAVPYITKEFPEMSEDDARNALLSWMKNYDADYYV